MSKQVHWDCLVIRTLLSKDCSLKGALARGLGLVFTDVDSVAVFSLTWQSSLSRDHCHVMLVLPPRVPPMGKQTSILLSLL
jgi:hypothetical protein